MFGPFGPSPPRDYSESEINDFKHKPGALLELRKQSETRVNHSFEFFISSSPAQAKMRSHLTQEMKRRLQSPSLEAIIIPTTGVGCRRPTPGIHYLESLTAPNVTVVHGPISKIVPSGCVSQNGALHALDILICATGFNTSYVPRFPLLGHSGTNLQDQWAAKPAAYLATAAADFPNYLIFYGPGNPWASGSFLSMIECQADYILKLVDRYQAENIHSFAPKKEAVADLMAHSKRVLAKTVWAEGCSSWYKKNGIGTKRRKRAESYGTEGEEMRSSEAESLMLWPGSGLHFVEAMAEVRADDWEIVYRGNRFEWLGNGFSQTETDPESDVAWYMREKDDGPLLSREKRRKLATRKVAVGGDDREGRLGGMAL